MSELNKVTYFGKYMDDYYNNRFDDLPLFDQAHARKQIQSHRMRQMVQQTSSLLVNPVLLAVNLQRNIRGHFIRLWP